MSAITLQQMADRVAQLLEARLAVKGRGLTEKLRRGGSKLPRKVRRAAQDLAAATEMGQNPKLFLQLDQAAIALAYDTCLRHLNGLQKWDRRRAFAEGWALSLMLSLLVLAALIVLVLNWRGYL